MKRFMALLSCAALGLAACAPKDEVKLLPAEAFETSIDGAQTSLYTIKGDKITVQITNFGARIVSIWAPDRKGRMGDVAVGYENIDRYINFQGERFMGPVVGPVANRIGGASFELDGETYSLPDNDHGNTLHGGLTGVDRLVWTVTAHSENSVEMTVRHPDGLEGFPGNLDITARFSICDCDALKIEYSAVTDKATPVNLSCHAFFNLTGDCSKSILGHELKLWSEHTTAIDNLLIPTGEICPVEGTPFDFREAKAIGERVDADNEQLRNGNGYDHNWCIDLPAEKAHCCKGHEGHEGHACCAAGLHPVAEICDPESGRSILVISDQPGFQFYCGNFFDGGVADKYGHPINFRSAFVLETQKYPDAVHQAGFPSIILQPGETYSQTCVFKFGTK